MRSGDGSSTRGWREGCLEELDSSALACVQADGRQGDRSRKMAQESLFSKDRRSAARGGGAKISKRRERDLLFAIRNMEMDGEESNHEH